MRDGLIVQCAPPDEVYLRPADAAVARLTGEAIFLAAVLRDGIADTALGHLRLHCGTAPAGPPLGSVEVMLRPEQIVLQRDGGGVPARVLASRFQGDHRLVTLEIGGISLDARLPAGEIHSGTLRIGVTGPVVAFDHAPAREA